MTTEDGLQAAWAKTVDAAAELEQTGDADAIAAAIVAADQPDAAQAVSRDAACPPKKPAWPTRWPVKKHVPEPARPSNQSPNLADHVLRFEPIRALHRGAAFQAV